MDKCNELTQLRIEATHELRPLLEKQAKGATLTAEERKRADFLGAEVHRLEGEEVTERRRLAAEDAQLAIRPSGRLAGLGFAPGTAPAAPGRKYAELFGPPQASGFERRADFWHAVGAGVSHPGLVYAGTMGEGIGSDGGFLVPDELVAQTLDAALEDEPILSQVTIEPMASEAKRVAGFTTANHTTAGPFGFSGGWVGEGASLTAEKGLVRSIKLQAKKLALLVQASNEVVGDGAGLETQLDSAMRRALGWLLAEAVFNGTGAGQPLGILKGPDLVVVAKEAGQTADTVNYVNVTKMLSRLLPSSMGRAVFYASHTTRPELMKLSVAVGTGGSHIPLVLGPDGRYRLLGIPLYWTEHVPALGDQGDLVLCDPSQYVLGMRKQVTMDRSQHVGFTSDLMTYRGIVRADGMSKFDGAFTPKTGTTQSPFVVLAERA
jgi:HK97 family phage major capsid protein